jgi:hypothetical protein
MIEMMGEQYLTEKEAEKRYGYSSSWFARSRVQKFGPHYVQLKPHGRVLYPLESTDKWFRSKMMELE